MHKIKLVILGYTEGCDTVGAIKRIRYTSGKTLTESLEIINSVLENKITFIDMPDESSCASLKVDLLGYGFLVN